MTLAKYLMKGAAYGGATGAAMGVVDDDIGIFEIGRASCRERV